MLTIHLIFGHLDGDGSRQTDHMHIYSKRLKSTLTQRKYLIHYTLCSHGFHVKSMLTVCKFVASDKHF